LEANPSKYVGLFLGPVKINSYLTFRKAMMNTFSGKAFPYNSIAIFNERGREKVTS